MRAGEDGGEEGEGKGRGGEVREGEEREVEGLGPKLFWPRTASKQKVALLYLLHFIVNNSNLQLPISSGIIIGG